MLPLETGKLMGNYFKLIQTDVPGVAREIKQIKYIMKFQLYMNASKINR